MVSAQVTTVTDEWTYVGRKKSRRKTKEPSLKEKNKETDIMMEAKKMFSYSEKAVKAVKPIETVVERTVNRVRRLCSSMRRSSFYIHVRTTLQSCISEILNHKESSSLSSMHLVCYGLGSFCSGAVSSHHNAIYQLACAILLHEDLPLTNAFIYDPVMIEVYSSSSSSSSSSWHIIIARTMIGRPRCSPSIRFERAGDE
jgi:hypothetical protein